jgi:hypothetical protein
MGEQLRFVSKEEAHKLIDAMPGNCVLVIKYNNIIGMSDNEKYVKKKRGKRYVDKSETLVLPILTLNLHDKFIKDFSEYNRENIVRSIMLAKLE